MLLFLCVRSDTKLVDFGMVTGRQDLLVVPVDSLDFRHPVQLGESRDIVVPLCWRLRLFILLRHLRELFSFSTDIYGWED